MLTDIESLLNQLIDAAGDAAVSECDICCGNKEDAKAAYDRVQRLKLQILASLQAEA